ncbi:hypothetical protein SDC9_85229 [bioreactor metagenome]|uniref:Uncharacterized protein n=1 Tax=bioreactor metagenome TaxID=1076179 RepID=A0A644ZCJ9_9ZZZZ
MAQASGQVIRFVPEVFGKYGGLFVMATTYKKIGMFAAPAQGELNIGVCCRPSDQFVLPIRVTIFIPGAVDIVRIGRIFRDPVIDKRLPAHVQVLLRIHQFHFVSHPAESIISVYAEIGFSANFSFFRGDQYHAVGATGPVNGGGIRVFQYLDALDIIGIDGIERIYTRIG